MSNAEIDAWFKVVGKAYKQILSDNVAIANGTMPKAIEAPKTGATPPTPPKVAAVDDVVAIRAGIKKLEDERRQNSAAVATRNRAEEASLKTNITATPKKMVWPRVVPTFRF